MTKDTKYESRCTRGSKTAKQCCSQNTRGKRSIYTLRRAVKRSAKLKFDDLNNTSADVYLASTSL